MLILRKKALNVYTEIYQRFSKWERSYEASNAVYSISSILDLLKEKIIVHIDLSATKDFDHAYRVLSNLLKKVYDTALDNPSFGCIAAIDEAHLYAPERGGVSLMSDEKITNSNSLKNILHLIILHLIATTGPRNGITPFMATQRPSLILRQ